MTERPPATSERLPAVLAIDAGNSKTAAALVAADGTLLASGTGPGVPAMLSGETVRVLEIAVRAALSAMAPAGVRPAGRTAAATAGPAAGRAGAAPGPAADRPETGRPETGRPPPAGHLVACVANADLPQDEQRLAEMLRTQGWSQTVDVTNDTFAVLRAGLVDPGPGAWGVAVTCGAGINCVGVAPDGRTARYLALGTISGDWGGGLDLGLATLWLAARAEDGRGGPTRLREAVANHFGVPEVRDVIIGIHHGKIAKDDLLGLAPVLLEVANTGDEAARGLVRRQADEICVMAGTVIRRLGLATAPAIPVVLGGGLLMARDPLLTGWVLARLAAEVPGAEPRIVDIPPVAGAALLGLDRAGAGAAAEQRLRAAYPPVNRPVSRANAGLMDSGIGQE
jgi:N-acetylglucosamine kinase-like BadF-type ATPase